MRNTTWCSPIERSIKLREQVCASGGGGGGRSASWKFFCETVKNTQILILNA